MKRISMMLMLIFVISLVPFLPVVDSASAAGLYVGVWPNPGQVGQVITIKIEPTDEQSLYQWGDCELLVYFGDGTPAPNIGKLTPQAPTNALGKSTTHKYTRMGTFTIEVIPVACATSKAASVKTSVRITPLKQVLPVR